MASTSDRVKWITHKGKKILLLDYSGLQGPEMRKMFPRVLEEYIKQPENSVLSIADFTSAFVTDNVVEDFKDLVIKTAKYDKESVTVGMSLPKKIMLKVVNAFTQSNIKPFNTRDEALEYLATK